MDRFRDIANLWNWLPAFRAVAETGNVRRAAERLHVSPSALSRTVRLLEDEIGKPLFDRVGRTLRLNDAGEQLLAAVRDSMRRVDDAKQQIDTRLLAGPVTMRAPGTVIHAFLVALVHRLGSEHPELVPALVPDDGSDPYEALLIGDIDLAFSSRPLAHDELTTVRLGACTGGVYCGPGHPLHGRDEVSVEDIASHPFVAPPAEDGVPLEGWPAEVPRRIGVYVSSLAAGLEICRAGTLLAVLPDVIARREPHAGVLYRLPFDELQPVSFFVCHRPAVTEGGRVEVALTAVREVFAEELENTGCAADEP